MKKILLQVGAGELLDRVTILEMREHYARAGGQRERVHRELERLARQRSRAGLIAPELEPCIAELRSINRAIWAIQDQLRACEATRQFGPSFVALARALARNNDRRAAVKRRIDERCGSEVTDEKIYAGAPPTDAVLRILSRV